MKNIIRIPAKILQPVRDYLLRQQQKLVARRHSLGAEDPFADETRVDDNADIGMEAREQFGHQRVEALRNEIDRTLITVRKSLTKIKIGQYGLCENCGQLIDTDRLAINPTAAFCIRCEQQVESGNRRRPRK